MDRLLPAIIYVDSRDIVFAPKFKSEFFGILCRNLMLKYARIERVSRFRAAAERQFAKLFIESQAVAGRPAPKTLLFIDNCVIITLYDSAFVIVGSFH